MARERHNPFKKILEEGTPTSTPVIDYAPKGASRTILNSLDEIAARADKLAEGETIVELEPDEIDPSFVRDRRTEDEDEFNELLAAIRDRGQDSPVLVRPHPSATGRYMLVFGHRRVRVARALGRKVRAVVKAMEDRDHVLALGQENSARANVPFIERALFAADLAHLRYDQDNSTILSALSVDRATLSKLLSVASLPPPILEAIGQARGVGRDRWYELKQLIDNPANQERALQAVREEAFVALPSEERFDWLVRRLKSRPSRKPTDAKARSWAPKDSSMSAQISAEGKRFTLALKAKSSDARAFGEYLSERLDQLYESFRQESTSQKDGG